MYALPPELLLPTASIAKCRWSAYSSELILYNYLLSLDPASSAHPSPFASTSPVGSRGIAVTQDPDEADFFFVPAFPACYLFNCWDKNEGWNQNLRCSVDKVYLEPILDYVEQQSGYKASRGRNHIIVHPMDHGTGYYTAAVRTRMQEMIHLVTVGDVRAKPFSGEYRHGRDVVIPSATHLLHSYWINPRDYVDAAGHPLGKLPGRLSEPTGIRLDSPTLPITASTSTLAARPYHGRDSIALFRGLASPSPPTPYNVTLAEFAERYSLNIRSLFYPSTSGPPHRGFSSLAHYDIQPSSTNEEYALALSQARYGLVPPGFTLDTTRLYEYLAFGVVPVFIGTGRRGGQVLPFGDDVDWDALSLFIPRERAHELPAILAAVSEQEWERKRVQVWSVGTRLLLEEQQGHVWELIGRELCRRFL